jgi:antitoxin VapB
MPFTIDDPQIERLARELAAATGEPVQHALAAALRERLARVRPAPAGVPAAGRLGTVAEIQAYLAALPELDARPPEAILGYDALGLPR